MAPGQPRVRHNGHVTKRVMLVLLNVCAQNWMVDRSSSAWWNCGKQNEFSSQTHSTDELFNLSDLGFLLYKTELVITSIANSYCGDEMK